MVNKAKLRSGINTLAYMGIEPITAPLLLVEQRIPTIQDRASNQIGALWILEQTDTVPARIFLLVRLQGSGPSGIATWMELQTGFGGESFVTDNATTAIPVASIINFLGGTSAGGIATNLNTFAFPDGSNNLFVALNNSISQPDTNAAGTAGLYSLGGFRFMHNFGTRNTFLGANAGNLTLTGSDLVGIGNAALTAATTMVDSVAVGSGALLLAEDADRNIAIGSDSLGNNVSSNDQIAIGTNSLNAVTATPRNVAIGTNAMAAYTGIVSNESSLAIGYNAMAAADTNVRMIAIGDSAMSVGQGNNSIAIGYQAAENMGLSSSSVLLGYQAGRNLNMGGVINGAERTIAIGTQAMGVGIVTGEENIMIGFQAGNNITSATECVGIGPRSQLTNLTGDNNISIGNNSLNSIASGTNNISIGISSGSSLTLADSSNIDIGNTGTVGDNNTIRIGTTGSGAGQQNRFFTGGVTTIAAPFIQPPTVDGRRYFMFIVPDTEQVGTHTPASLGVGDPVPLGRTYGFNNIFLGRASGNETLNPVAGGCIQNLAFGTRTMMGLTEGDGNCAHGHESLMSVSTGSFNIALGINSLDACTTSSDNIGIGRDALGSLTTSVASNIAIGALALSSETTGTENIAIGANVLDTANGSSGNTIIGFSNAGNDLTTGSTNTGVGAGVLDSITTGSSNSAFGVSAGSALTGADSSNIMIKHVGISGDNNTIRIGTNGAGAGQQNRCFVAGIRGIATGVADAVAVLVDSANQLGTISSSRRFKENIHDMAEDSSAVMKLRPVTFRYKSDVDKKLQYGLIAEEVEEYMPRMVVYDEDGLPMTVKYHELPAILLNELQKLTKRVEELEHKMCDTCKA